MFWPNSATPEFGEATGGGQNLTADKALARDSHPNPPPFRTLSGEGGHRVRSYLHFPQSNKHASTSNQFEPLRRRRNLGHEVAHEFLIAERGQRHFLRFEPRRAGVDCFAVDLDHA